MALTPKQLEDRRTGIGASDAITIMWGDSAEWRELRAEKVDGVQKTFDDKRRLLMDMGHAIEPLTLRTFDTRHHRLKPIAPDLRVVWKVDPFFAFTPDGITEGSLLPVQCKFHTGDKDILSLADFYGPQLLHEMIVSGVKKCYLAVIFGHYGRFQHLEVNWDDEAADAYLQRALAFKEYMLTGIEPEWMVSGVNVAIPRRRDHLWAPGDNEVASLALDVIRNVDAKAKFEEALEELKLKVPGDCASATWVGHDGIGIKFKIASNGAKRWAAIAPAAPTPLEATIKLNPRGKRAANAP